MTLENMRRGVEIQARLEKLNSNLKGLQNSNKLSENQEYIQLDWFVPNKGRFCLDAEFIDFDTMKALSEKKIEREIKELEKEFKQL